MAVNEVPGLMRYKDKEGNINILLPITNKDNVDGMDEIEASLSETIKFTEQTLTDDQKAQARVNIGVGSITGYIIQPEPPENTHMLWIDTSDGEAATV